MSKARSAGTCVPVPGGRGIAWLDKERLSRYELTVIHPTGCESCGVVLFVWQEAQGTSSKPKISGLASMAPVVERWLGSEAQPTEQGADSSPHGRRSTKLVPDPQTAHSPTSTNRALASATETISNRCFIGRKGNMLISFPCWNVVRSKQLSDEIASSKSYRCWGSQRVWLEAKLPT